MMNDEVYKEAIASYGTEPQIDMAIEEMAELTDALMKFRRGRRTVDDIVEEVADVTIMARQLAIIFGLNNVDTMIDYKTQRLRKRLEEKN